MTSCAVPLWIALAWATSASLGGARQLAAQADVIRGRVTSTSLDSEPIPRASVTATSLTGNVNRSTLTDANGRYTITFPEAEGDYFVTVVAIGYSPRRVEVKRTADQDILLGDVRLTPVGAVLDPTTVTAQGTRSRPRRGSDLPDIPGTQRAITSSLVPIDQVGDLAAMAATLPGVLFIAGTNGDPAGFSVLGLDQAQNGTTLNGLAIGATDVPRDAAVSISLAVSPYDVSQGQFSGGRLMIRTAPGSNYITRASSAVMNAPQLEWTDPTGRALGQQYANVNVGGATSGPFALDKAFYNVSFQAGRRMSDLQTLLNTDALGLQADGVARDSLSRLLNMLSADDIPATVGGVPTSRLTDQGRFLGSFDFTPPTSTSGQAFSLTVAGNWNRSSPAASLATTLPAASFDATNWNAVVQGHHSGYYGNIFSETGVSLSASRRYLTPFSPLPGGSVFVSSAFADGTSGGQNIIFGGATTAADASASTLDATNQLSWFSLNNKHRVKLATELRRDGFSVEQSTDPLGAFAYNSLTDFDAGTPASFTRELTPLRAGGGEWLAGASLGESYRRTPNLQIVYGVRLDANRYENTPTLNPLVAENFGVSNVHVPDGVSASPRIGFSWTYGTASQVSPFEGAARVPRAVVSGGIGVFQNALAASLPSQAMTNTGLQNAQRQITCVGPATPVPDWGAYVFDPSSIPTQCINATGSVFANAAPNVTLFAPNYAAQRSVRSTLQWAGAVLDNRAKLTIGGTYSRNLNQPGFVDINLDSTVRLTLPDEGNRPVFVSPANIVPATGAIAAGDGRVSPSFNHVVALRSDFASTTRQVSVQLTPASVNSQLTWGLVYTYNRVNDEVGGFTSTAGDPFALQHGRASADWRHQIIGTFGSNFFDVVRLNWTQFIISGMPFTPIVASDINGDGYANDRAFIANPAKTADSTLAASMRALIAGSGSRVRDCLETQLGRIAALNSCEGPWTSTAFLTLSFNPVRVRLPQRATLSLTLGNPLGAADVLLHGEEHEHGWGQAALPDPRLLFVRGFDPTSRAYTYAVNSRFGSTSQAVSPVRNPVTLTVLLKLDVGPTRERQGLTQLLDRGRRTPGSRASEGIVKLMYGSAGLVNPFAAILVDGTTLGLSPAQADTITVLNRDYIVQLDSIWSPAAKYFAELPEAYDQGAAYDRYRRAREASVDLLVRFVPDVNSLLSAAQRRKLPDLIAAYLDLRYLAAIRAGTSGTPGGVFAPTSGTATAAGGRSG